jgi:alpha-D-xyloside xylohydrolase
VSGKTLPRLEFRDSEHWLLVEPWGPDSVRVRAGRGAAVEVAQALLAPAASDVTLEEDECGSALVNGRLTVHLSTAGALRFNRSADQSELLAEAAAHFAWPGPRLFSAQGHGYYRLEQRFRAYPDEQIFGMGQHQHGRLDQKGMVLDLVQRNSEVSIPFMISSRGYGLLWNSPAVGRAEFAENGTRWVADSARQIDYWVTVGEGSAEILENYADATGHAPPFPEWALGLWQSKLRYESQSEVLTVAKEYQARGLPLEVMTIDYYHWPRLGDWRFAPDDWPDPRAMVTELTGMGVRTMVSVWPSLSPLSENYAQMRDAGYLVATEHGTPAHHLFPDKGFHGKPMGVSFYDATDAAARDLLWSKLKSSYYDLGVRLWWLDGCEPEIYPEQFANLRYHAGPGREVTNIYPLEHVRGLYEHMVAEGETEIISLVRSAWAGSQRYGALLWSGDVPATFAALRVQIRAGLSAGLSGIPWWTTDIGGFHGGDPADPAYQELMVRWFQYGVFCPVLRMHGHREPRGRFGASHSGGPNELWSFGAKTYSILVDQLQLRERLRPYLAEQMQTASTRGLPPMRPLFVDFPADPHTWRVEDEFLLGPDLLVAPVTIAAASQREVYLPDGTDWIDLATGDRHTGGTTLTVAVALEDIPVFSRAGSMVHRLWSR